MPTNQFLEYASVIKTREVAPQTFLTEFSSPKISAAVKPGQFVMLSFPGSLDPLLPRAFSVCEVKGDSVVLFYVAVGKGTRLLSKLRNGEQVILNGPLGRGFPELARGEKVWLAVGGSGAAVLPIIFTSATDSGAFPEAFYGARTMKQLMHFDNIQIEFATDDGSAGFHGTVVELLKLKMGKDRPDKIFACGPSPMLASVQREFGDEVRTYISVETPMACGMGLCQGCPVRKRDGTGYYLACKDGPVFDANEIEVATGSI